MMYSWAEGKEFFEYSWDFKAHLNKRWELDQSILVYLAEGNEAVKAHIVQHVAPGFYRRLRAEYETLL